MPVIDFHNHFYPAAYLDALRSGASRVQVTIDDEGNPRLHYPGDYNIAVRGHRDIDYRNSVMDESRVDTQIISLTTPGTHVEEPALAVELARLVNDGFAEIARNYPGRFIGIGTLPLSDPTGSAKELKLSDLHDSLVRGTSLQLGLYALAMRERGAADVSVSIISLAVKNVAPQLSVVDLAPHSDVFADLAEMQRIGVFGMKSEIRPAFGYSAPYPLATLPVDNDILEDKWALTHPALVLEKEEWEIW